MKPFLLSLALGPLTGPLALGLVVCLKGQRFFMAGVYALGLVEVWVGLPSLLRQELMYLSSHFGA